jgi:hypothetical protein
MDPTTQGCWSPVYLHRTYIYHLVHITPCQDDLQYLIQCKYPRNSCYTVLFRGITILKNSVPVQYRHNFLTVFYLRLIELQTWTPWYEGIWGIWRQSLCTLQSALLGSSPGGGRPLIKASCRLASFHTCPGTLFNADSHSLKLNLHCSLENPIACRCQWLTPVILATQEAEIRRILVQSQPGQIVLETLSWKNPSQKKAGGVAQGVDPEFKPQYRKKKKKKKKERKKRKSNNFLCSNCRRHREPPRLELCFCNNRELRIAPRYSSLPQKTLPYLIWLYLFIASRTSNPIPWRGSHTCTRERDRDVRHSISHNSEKGKLPKCPPQQNGF